MRAPGQGPADWFRTAVFYEVMVSSFSDSDGDGVGDLAGLRQRLEYLEWLGVDCLWLLPIYPSPLRDGGYDVSDFRGVRSELGSMDDLEDLLADAHGRGMRVILDLVINHTSDQHPWFQASRSEADGLFGGFYTWADSDDSHREARVIFIDTERSNWALDPVRSQYYWHRFFSHQPDLDYTNPDVHDAALDVIRFWLDLGVDGLRLDAVPYLCAEDGTTSENLPGTHDFLRRARRVVDTEYPGRILLAEANQLPADTVSYFGDESVGGDECHMAFHFPLMPRMFLALARQQAEPISAALAATPPIPSGCQWAIFLRNHDELTLEMVTPVERRELYGAYAPHPRMRSNVGIRRRLASLLDNDFRRLDLMHALLLSLPGTPVLYYGDEIGMGDNIWLPDRDGVRTPMQWHGGRNAGFSTTSQPAQLPIPLLDDDRFGPDRVNVSDQRGNPGSLLHRVRRLLAVRSGSAGLTRGALIELDSGDSRVLAFQRGLGADRVTCLFNLSSEPVRIRPPAEAGSHDLISGRAFVDQGESSTLRPYAAWWLTGSA